MIAAPERIASNLIFFYHEDFSNLNRMRAFIEKGIPDYEKYLIAKKKIRANNINTKIDTTLLPCCEEPLLSYEQEVYLFKLMNYYKYRAKTLEDRIKSLSRTRQNTLDKIDRYIERYRKTKNLISLANFRLAASLTKQYLRKFNVSAFSDAGDSFFSDAYFTLMYAVEKFDYRKGLKFSTFATWVIRNSFTKNFLTAQSRLSHELSISDLPEESYASAYHPVVYDGKKDNTIYHAKLVKKLIKHCPDRDGKIISRIFGLGCKPKKLREIGVEFNVSFERVRQLKDRGLKKIQAAAKKLNIQLDEPEFNLMTVEEFATMAHEGQKRKYSGLDYIVHPKQVYQMVCDWLLIHPQSQEVETGMRNAALCHDIAEDCPQIDPDDLRKVCGEFGYKLVLELTNPSKGSKAVRSVRKAMDREHIAKVSFEAKIIKLMDRFANVCDFALCPDKKFAFRYADESEELLKVLTGTDKELEETLAKAISNLKSLSS